MIDRRRTGVCAFGAQIVASGLTESWSYASSVTLIAAFAAAVPAGPQAARA